ncbi:MAG TPA: hypothetical protein VFT90_11040 [Chryseosolibacter sp.]|nr:hypothetical protein [Chryseosolibacter sp.]
MEAVAALIIGLFLITFAPPVIFFIIGLFKRNTNKDTAKVFFILAAAWLIIGGGMCFSMMS